ncbi:hypothetical protein TSAR_009570 [Trichomalopsis sarcophagae]|uniref:DUF4794 domain-containing protein n=1 Tax=Trichomalopsis sarcophagae TaxID=543379 RepID=A0A232FDP7_9HYME|nr:hypothetical protein TSAR_009570 [Trichomalopsis sarcophagae]
MVSKFAIIALAVAALAVLETEAKAVPVPAAEPMPMVVDVFGSPLLFARDKRASAYRTYPQRTMMFTGFYRPTRHSEDDQAGGVYAQGGSVGGGAYFGKQPQYLNQHDGPQPVDEPEISSADAEASPAAPEDDGQEEPQAQEHESSEQQPQENPDTEAENPIFHDSPKPEKPVQKQPSKSKKGKKIPTPSEDESDEYDADEEDEPVSPFRPGKGKPNKQYPSLNNFFPMVFSFPRGTAGRRGSSSGSVDSIPGMITAIANSFSTGKGGIASSVATAYGGSSTKKPRRPSQSPAH